MSDEITREQAVQQIASLTEAAYESIRQAEELAKKYDCDFSFSVAYGMGGHFSKEEPWDSSSSCSDESTSEPVWEWMSSSAQC